MPRYIIYANIIYWPSNDDPCLFSPLFFSMFGKIVWFASLSEKDGFFTKKPSNFSGRCCFCSSVSCSSFVLETVCSSLRWSTGMSMELSNYLVSWVVTYLGDLQPTYIGVIIYLLSSMDILVQMGDATVMGAMIMSCPICENCKLMTTSPGETQPWPYDPQPLEVTKKLFNGVR